MFDYKVIEKEIKVFRFFFFSFLHSFLFAEKNFSSTFVWLISRTTYKVHIVKISRSAANCVFTYPSDGDEWHRLECQWYAETMREWLRFVGGKSGNRASRVDMFVFL